MNQDVPNCICIASESDKFSLFHIDALPCDCTGLFNVSFSLQILLLSMFCDVLLLMHFCHRKYDDSHMYSFLSMSLSLLFSLAHGLNTIFFSILWL